jgi:hypothetical protein
MNTLKLSRILRDAKPTDPALHDGWSATVIQIARRYLLTDETFNALGFMAVAGVDPADERRLSPKAA